MSEKLLEVKDLSFSYANTAYNPHPVLDCINLTLHEKDFWAVIGPNGGGKTTLIKLILGLLKPQSGTITLSPTLQKSHIGYVSQVSNFSLDFPISVRDVITLGLLKPTLGGFRSKLCATMEEKIQAIMHRLEIAHLSQKPIGTLSGGQRQRVLIAQAIVCEPKLLILDEPTANVDVRAQEGIYELLKALNNEMSIMIVSHDIAFTLGYATQVLYVNGYALCHNIPQDTILPSNGHICEVDLLSLYASSQAQYSESNHNSESSHTTSKAREA